MRRMTMHFLNMKENALTGNKGHEFLLYFLFQAEHVFEDRTVVILKIK